MFDQIRQDIADFRTLGKILSLGDMNAHISPTTLDYIDLDNIDDFLPHPEVGQYKPDTPIKRNTLELKEMTIKGNYLSHFASRLHLEFSMENVEVILMVNLHASLIVKSTNQA